MKKKRSPAGPSPTHVLLAQLRDREATPPPSPSQLLGWIHRLVPLLLLLPEYPGIRPAVVRFMFGGDRLPFGFPAEPAYVDAYVCLLGDSGLPWMVTCYGGDVLPLAEHAIRRGGHVRVGLEDNL